MGTILFGSSKGPEVIRYAHFHMFDKFDIHKNDIVVYLNHRTVSSSFLLEKNSHCKIVKIDQIVGYLCLCINENLVLQK